MNPGIKKTWHMISFMAYCNLFFAAFSLAVVLIAMRADVPTAIIWINVINVWLNMAAVVLHIRVAHARARSHLNDMTYSQMLAAHQMKTDYR